MLFPFLLQVVEVLHDPASKTKWLLDRLQSFTDEGEVLVFANQKARVDELAAALGAAGARWAAMWTCMCTLLMLACSRPIQPSSCVRIRPGP
jgi:hypothetical protein